jgi:hypothetical protein
VITGWGDVVRTSILAELTPVESVSHEERAALVKRSPGAIGMPPGRAFDEARQVDDFVENSGLTTLEVLGPLFDTGLRGVIRQLPGKQFLKVLL